MRASGLLGVFVLTVSCHVVAAGFTFIDFFDGEWEVQKSTVKFKTGEQVNDDTSLTSYFMNKDESGNLVGRSLDNSTTGETSNELNIFIEASEDDANTGSFKTGTSDDTEDMTTLFRFSFTRQSNGLFMSHGEWLGSKDSLYQFTCIMDKFILTVIPKAPTPDSELTVYTGRKVIIVKEKTFFQKYGTMIMIGVFFFMNTMLKNRMQTRTGAAPNVGAGGGGADAAPTTEESAGPAAHSKTS